MKSSNSQLRKRGMIDEGDINKFEDYSEESLFVCLKSDDPVERTVAVRLLSEKFSCNNKDYVNVLLSLLSTEKALYTRLEIFNFLETGNKTTAKLMTNYLGKIGNNQHKKIPNKVSKKKSYPLPRDIIARTLGKMDCEVLEVLFSVLESKNKAKISEVLDAIGFLIFYNSSLATVENFNVILSFLFDYSDDGNVDVVNGEDVIVWKIFMCFSAFPLEECREFLEGFIVSCGNDCDSNNVTDNMIVNEAKRSLKIIGENK
ncbi:MAG: hypothetical protein ACRCVG_00770 [Methanobacteriaceae archaeon]